MFCNKRFKSFLESQTFKGKPTPLLAIKKLYSFDAAACHLFTH